MCIGNQYSYSLPTLALIIKLGGRRGWLFLVSIASHRPFIRGLPVQSLSPLSLSLALSSPLTSRCASCYLPPHQRASAAAESLMKCEWGFSCFFLCYTPHSPVHVLDPFGLVSCCAVGDSCICCTCTCWLWLWPMLTSSSSSSPCY